MSKVNNNVSKIAYKPNTYATLSSFLYKNNIGCRIIELEIILDCDEFTIKEIQELIDLYTQAVDYYVKRQSTYYLYFQNKMKKLMLKPRVVKLIEMLDNENKKIKEKKQSPRVVPKRERELSVGNKEVVASLKRENLEITRDLGTMNQNDEITGVLKDLKVNKEKKKRVFESSLERQKYDLSKRLEKRKTNSFRNSFSKTKSYTEDLTFDEKTCGFLSTKNFNEYDDVDQNILYDKN